MPEGCDDSFLREFLHFNLERIGEGDGLNPTRHRFLLASNPKKGADQLNNYDADTNPS
jgi:hypothetical protein